MAKAEVCKTSIRRFDSGRRLQSLLFGPLIGAGMYSAEDSPRASGIGKSATFGQFADPVSWHPTCFGGRQEARDRGPERRQTVRRARLILTAATLLVAGAGPAFAQGLDLRIGGFFPRTRDCGIPSSQRAEYSLFQDVCELFTVGNGDFDGVYGGVEYNQVLTDFVEVGVHYDYYSRTTDSTYRDYTWDDGSEIRQQLRLRWRRSASPFGSSRRARTPRSCPTWAAASTRSSTSTRSAATSSASRRERSCRFDYDVVPDAFVSESVAFGYHALGGIRVYLNRDFAIVGEGRYQWAQGRHGRRLRAQLVWVGEHD